MIFVNLIYRHFDILVSHYDQMNKSHDFQGCSKIVFLASYNKDQPRYTLPNPNALCVHYRSWIATWTRSACMSRSKKFR